MFQEKIVEKFKAHILCSVIFFLFENRAVCEIMCRNIVEPDRPRMTMWRMRIACWVPKATNTHSEYVVLIAFALQQRWHESGSTVHYTNIAGIVRYSNCNVHTQY